MITGDHKDTAVAIAGSWAGIIDEKAQGHNRCRASEQEISDEA